jgi:hypothetical protein
LLVERGGELQGLLTRAQVEGNTQAVEELTVQIEENKLAIEENTRAAFDAARQTAERRFAQTSSLIDIGIRIAQLSGPGFTPNRQAIIGLLRQRGAALTGRGGELRGLFDRAVMEGNTQATDELRLQIEENTVAILENNKQLAEITGAIDRPQTFASEFWDRFRVALFTGGGSLLPNYRIPQMAGGGYVRRDGLFYLHAGESVVTPDQMTSAGDVNITINEAGQPTDPLYIAERISFARKQRI